MRVLVIVPKPSLAQALAASIQRTVTWPGAEITIIPVMLGLFRISYPDRLASRDFPRVSDVAVRPGWPGSHHPAKWSAWRATCGVREIPSGRRAAWHGDDGFWFADDVADALGSPDTIVDCLQTLFSNADLFVAAPDAWSHALLGVKDILDCGLAVSVKPPVLRLHLTDLRPDHVDAALSNMVPWRPDSDDVRYAEGRRFLDYNWHLNASALLAETLRRAGFPSSLGDGADKEAAVSRFSKYTLLMALHLAAPAWAGQTWTDGQIITQMARWQGSGKYRDADVSDGSEISRSAIVQNMLALGILERTPDVRWNGRWPLGYQDCPPRLRRVSTIVGGVLDQSLETEMTVRELLALAGDIDQMRQGLPPQAVPEPMEAAASGLLGSAVRAADSKHLWESPISREVLKDIDLAWCVQNRSRVSDRGRRLAAMLPKGAYDPDFPFRMDGWAKAWPGSRPQVERYLTQFFGAIKRANGMESLAGTVGHLSSGEVVRMLGSPDEAARESQVRPAVVDAALSGELLSPRARRALLLAARRKIARRP